MSHLDTDLAFMLGGLDSKSLKLGSFSGTCLLVEMDALDADPTGAPVLARRTTAVVAKADFLDSLGAVTVARGDTATIDGTDYGVTDVRVGGVDGMEIDGRELHLTVRKV